MAPTTRPGHQPLDDETDLLVVGSGVTGAVAALAARAAGLRVVVVEKTDRVGGNSAMSGGMMWVPNNPLQHEDGVPDSAEQAAAYLAAVLGPPDLASSEQRRAAFLSGGPRMIGFLRSRGLALRRCEGYSDYYPEEAGGQPRGRSVRMATFDLNRLGPWRPVLRTRNLFPGVPIQMEEVSDATVLTRTGRGAATVAGVAARLVAGRLRGQRPDTLGASLMGSLLLAVLQHGVAVHPEVGLTELTTGRGGVVGAVLSIGGGRTRRVRARAVLLASGGFSHNASMRADHGTGAEGTGWTLAGPGDTGEGILAGQGVGGAVALMDEAIWMGTSVRPDGTREMHLYDRALPHSIVVDRSGARFVNESVDYVRFGQALRNRTAGEPTAPCWLVLDSRHRRRYNLGDVPALLTPRSLLRQGYLHRSATLDGLARECGIDPVGLVATVARFNGMAARGVDDDFGRGASHYDRYLGDPRTRPNPALGPVSRPPFFAVPCHPGDVGTTGGLFTDAEARVLDQGGEPIPGLYAAGTCSATVMGRAYPGPGASIGAGATFGYLAAAHLAAAESNG